MGAFRRLPHGLVPGVIIAGFLALSTFSAQAGNISASGAISAVANVEYPVGVALMDELQIPEIDSDRAEIVNLVERSADLRLRAGRILLYSPSPEICIEITTADNAAVQYGNAPFQPMAAVSSDAGGNEGPLIDLLTLTPADIPSSQSVLIITVIPTGY
ncbi:MAG: hypothetical protein PHR28_04015 [candidate division Zixibacteria bacterium]|nr:hypothetical protein [candidate division Zixibacteria bacterium]